VVAKDGFGPLRLTIWSNSNLAGKVIDFNFGGKLQIVFFETKNMGITKFVRNK
jgi:hypothetical protein